MLGRPLYRFDRVSSTMDVLSDLAANSAPEGTTVVAGFQHAGRGRSTRQWDVPPDQALLASVLLRPDMELRRIMPLSILVADAIRETVGDLYGVNAKIKWPNDVLVRGRKLSGVLIQTRQDRTGPAPLEVLVGFGINANVSPADLPATGTSLLAKTGNPVDRDRLLRGVLNALDVRYRELASDSLGSRWQTIQENLAMRGELVRVEDAGRERVGLLIGVDRDGALILRENGRDVRIVAGDLSRGPKPFNQPGLPV